MLLLDSLVNMLINCFIYLFLEDDDDDRESGDEEEEENNRKDGKLHSDGYL